MLNFNTKGHFKITDFGLSEGEGIFENEDVIFNNIGDTTFEKEEDDLEPKMDLDDIMNEDLIKKKGSETNRNRISSVRLKYLQSEIREGDEITPRLKRSKTRNFVAEKNRAEHLKRLLNPIKPKTAEHLLGKFI